MGEGILIYGLNGSKRRYTRDLQGFADKVLASGRVRKSVYIFGKTNKAYLNDLFKKGIIVKSELAAITDKTILKYRNHPKKQKGATVNTHRFRMVESAVKKPKNVYIDRNRSRLIYVSSVKYSKGKVLKVVIEPNQKIGKRYYNQVVSIGVVDKNKMNASQYTKIK
jgi:hypothetical protein|nr:MAG TPA: hypothetical protein [Caudoviricetes sp.]DAT21581.1 MAG TPA: hypothetical protein [Caudoviricetes sp.]